MKKLRFIGILIITLMISKATIGQGLGDLIVGGKADANYLVSGYASPLIKAFGTGLNQGWYNTADTHKFPGGDLTLSVALVGAPSADRLFTVDNTKLQELQLDGVPATGKGDIPTFFGPTSTNQQFSLKDLSTQKYSAPSGIISRIPVPVANIGIGLPKGFTIKIRYIPTLNLNAVAEQLEFSSMSLGLWGVGVMHDFKQYIPGLKSLPFSMSVFAGYTRFNMELVMDESQGQKGKTEVSSTTIQVLASKKLAVLTVYGGVGYDISNGDLNLKGTYNFNTGVGTTTITDPVDFSTSASSPRITAGLRLKLGPITFHGDYTQAKYSAITAGFGVSVR